MLLIPTSRVTVCPADCFYQDEEQLYIDPESCVDCEACVEQCPVRAIFHDSSVPPQWAAYVEMNARRTRELKESGGNITALQEPKLGPGCCANR